MEAMTPMYYLVQAHHLVPVVQINSVPISYIHNDEDVDDRVLGWCRGPAF